MNSHTIQTQHFSRRCPSCNKQCNAKLFDVHYLSKCRNCGEAFVVPSIADANKARLRQEFADQTLNRIRGGLPYVKYVCGCYRRGGNDHEWLATWGLNGTAIYRADDPIWQVFLPPWVPRCNCSIHSMSIDQAASYNIQEAKRWARTGVPPIDPEFRGLGGAVANAIPSTHARLGAYLSSCFEPLGAAEDDDLVTEQQISKLIAIGFRGRLPESSDNAESIIESFESKLRMEKAKELLVRDHTLNGGIVLGLDGHLIEVQARAVETLYSPKPLASVTRITGMPRESIRESLARIGGAFSKLGIPDSNVEVLINLVPADLPKHGVWLDLPIAIIMLQASGFLPDLSSNKEDEFVLMGELGIHGEIRRVPGALSLAMKCRPGQKLIVPSGNEKECTLITAKPGHEGCSVHPVGQLSEVIEFFQGKRTLLNSLTQEIRFESAIPQAVDFGQVKGQHDAIDAAIIAAAGGHNLLLIGPPGEGKSLIANAMAGILPRLTNAEKVTLTQIYSACNQLRHDGMAVSRRPMRKVHHTASKQALIGGGSPVPTPGDVTLAHLGVLFLDEIPEFSRGTLEALRQPLEDGEVVISRTGATLRFPCNCTLVAAMNPCPCGHFGSDRCRCKPQEVKKYQAKLSGPLLDRIDLQVTLRSLTTEERLADTSAKLSSKIRETVEKAREMQRGRFSGTEVSCNAFMPGVEVRRYCDFSADGFQTFTHRLETNHMSTRSTDRLAKVSRTIADLNSSQQIEPEHVNRACDFVLGGMLRDGA